MQTSAQPFQWQKRSAGLKTLPRVFGFLWEAAPATVISAIIFRFATAVIPICVLYVSKRIIDMLVGKRTGSASGSR